MAITLVFLGKLADLAGTARREVEAPLDWSSLTEELTGGAGDMLDSGRVKIAVNGVIIPENAALSAEDGDEVARRMTAQVADVVDDRAGDLAERRVEHLQRDRDAAPFPLLLQHAGLVRVDVDRDGFEERRP